MAHATPVGPPPAVEIVGLLFGQPLAQMLKVVLEADIPDRLAGGAQSSEQLASASGFKPAPLGRVLGALTVFELLTEPEPNTFALGRLGCALMRDDPSYARDVVALEPFIEACWQQLPAVLQSGRTGPEAAYGAAIFEYFEVHPDHRAMFDRAMTG